MAMRRGADARPCAAASAGGGGRLPCSHPEHVVPSNRTCAEFTVCRTFLVGEPASTPADQVRDRLSPEYALLRRHSDLPPPICLSLANTACTSSSSFGLAACSASSAGCFAVVTSAGSSVTPRSGS